MSDPILQAAMSTSKHAAIVVSYSGETTRMVKVAHMLKERQTPIVAITSISQSELSHLADAILHISSREMLNTKIADFAFYGHCDLTSMVIPDSVSMIGGWAFAECESLKSVVIPDSVTWIGPCAFSGTPWERKGRK